MSSFFVGNYRGHDNDLGAWLQGHDAVYNLLAGLGCNGLSASVAMWLADAGKQESKIIIDLGDCAHRRTRILGDRFLLDGDGWGKAFDTVDIRLVHLLQKLASIS